MILEVKKAREQKSPVDFETIIALHQDLLSDRMISELGDCFVKGNYTLKNNDLVVYAQCTLSATVACEVCCTVFEKSFEFEVFQNIPLQKTEDSYYEVVNGVVDFDKIVLDEFLLSLPTRLTCKKSCALKENN